MKQIKLQHLYIQMCITVSVFLLTAYMAGTFYPNESTRTNQVFAYSTITLINVIVFAVRLIDFNEKINHIKK
jgi:hypothetical protein